MDNAHRTSFAYDAAGRELVRMNPLSQRTTLADPDGGTTTYVYDAAGRRTKLVNPFAETTTLVWDDAGRQVRKELDNGTWTSITYDAAGRTTAVANLKSDDSVISSFDYACDGAGNRLSVVEAGGDRVTWTYDRTYQLLTEDRSGVSGYTHTFSYDPVGNRLTAGDGTTVTTSVYDAANRLQTAEDGSGVTTYTFDANGNQRTVETPGGDVTTYVWDYENQMASAEDAAGDVTTYTYTAAEQRVGKETDTETVKFLWDGQNIVQEYDESDVTQADYTQDPQPAPQPFGNLVSQRRDTASSFYSFDALGSTRNLTDDAEVETDDYAYEAFGKVAASSGTTENPFQWVGAKGVYTQEDERRWMRAREMDSAAGRFLSEDPARDDSNLYRYTGNNPASTSDPSGLQDEPEPSGTSRTDLAEAELELERARTEGMALSLVHQQMIDLGEEAAANELLPAVLEAVDKLDNLSQRVDSIKNSVVTELKWPPDISRPLETSAESASPELQIDTPPLELHQALLVEFELQAALILELQEWQEVVGILWRQRASASAPITPATREGSETPFSEAMDLFFSFDRTERIKELQNEGRLDPKIAASLEFTNAATYVQAMLDIVLVGLPNAIIRTANTPADVGNLYLDKAVIDPIVHNDLRAGSDPEYAQFLRQLAKSNMHFRTYPELPLALTEGWVTDNPKREFTAFIGGESLLLLISLGPEAWIDDLLRGGTVAARATEAATTGDESLELTCRIAQNLADEGGVPSLGSVTPSGYYEGTAEELFEALRSRRSALTSAGRRQVDEIADRVELLHGVEELHLCEEAEYEKYMIRFGEDPATTPAYYREGTIYLRRWRGQSILEDLAHEGRHAVDFSPTGIFRNQPIKTMTPEQVFLREYRGYMSQFQNSRSSTDWQASCMSV
jgi:RHS repeat-associated protein